MKQFFKFLGYLFLGLIIVIVSILIYFQFGSNKGLIPFSKVPEDAIIVFETNNLTKTLLEITQTNYWRSTIESDAMADFKEGMIAYEETIANNKWLKPILKNQKLCFSLHQNKNNQSEFLIITDIKKYGNINLIPKLTGLFKINNKETKIDSTALHSIYIKKMEQTIHLATIDNLLLCSSSYQLVEKAIKQNIHLAKNEKKKQEEVLTKFTSDLFNIYIHINKLQDYILDNKGSTLFKGLASSALSGNFSEDNFSLSGYTNSYDSIASPFLALQNTSPGQRNTESVIPSDLFFYLNFNVKNFIQFYDDFLTQYSDLDPIGYSTYMAGLKLTESFLGVDLKNDFLSLLSGEIAIAMLNPMANSNEQDFLAVVKATDINKAKENLNEIARKIKNRTSFKFNQTSYKNFDINYLNIHGFFKLFMGGFLNNKEKPYYTIIDDFILFSNSSYILEHSIDTYLVGNTLKRHKNFQAFMNNFEKESQFTSFINMQTLYAHLYTFGNNADKKELKRYRQIIQNTGWVGFQLKPEGNMMKTDLFAQSLESSNIDYNVDITNHSATKLLIDNFKQLTFKIDLNDEFNNYNGKLDYYLTNPEKVQDSVLIYEGNLNNGTLQGLWRSYYFSGNIKSVATYNDSTISETAIFYYDDSEHTIKAEIDFNEDIIDGNYSEFYPNGNIKAKIEFENGIRWGNALYYFLNGQIKTEGRFKKGKQVGKWKYYSTTGELLKKESW